MTSKDLMSDKQVWSSGERPQAQFIADISWGPIESGEEGSGLFKHIETGTKNDILQATFSNVVFCTKIMMTTLKFVPAGPIDNTQFNILVY